MNKLRTANDAISNKKVQAILKIVDFEERENNAGVNEVANFIDGIAHASVFFSEATGNPAVRCTIGDADVTFDVPFSAYLMNDSGKTIEKIVKHESEVSKAGPIKTLHEAIDKAVTQSTK